MNTKPAYPRKVVNIMTKFANSCIDLKHRGKKRIVRFRKSNDGFAAHLEYYKKNQILVEYDFNDLGTESDKLFRANFISRCPLAQGFAEITLAILHELGHHVTQNDFDWAKYRLELFALQVNEKLTLEQKSERYFNMIGEKLATDWAIEWLQNAENRKLAKRFEKNFFKAFKG